MFLYTFFVLVTLFMVISFFDLIDDFVAHKAPWSLVGRYFLLKIPEAVFNMTPMAVLIGAILSFSLISRTREVIILLSAGLSIWRITSSVLIASFLISILVFLNGELLLPSTWKTARHIFTHQIKKHSEKGLVKQDKIWLKSEDGKIWNINFLNIKTEELFDVMVMEFAPDKTFFSSILKAKRAEMESGEWIFYDGFERKFIADGNFVEEPFKKRKIPATIQMEELKEAEKLPQEMNFQEMRTYVKKIKRAGYDHTRYSVDMYIKITFPLICLVMAFISIPFSIKTSRTSGALVGISMGISLGFVFWFFFSMGVSLGHSGKIPPLAAAGGAHAIFLIYALYRISTMLDGKLFGIGYRRKLKVK